MVTATTVALGLWGNQAHAAISTVSYTTSLAPQSVDFSSQLISVQQFDPSLGSLASVEIILQGTGTFTQQYENLTRHSASANIVQTLDFLLALPTPNANVLKVRQKETHNYQGAAFDGSVDFAGNSGDTATYDIDASKGKTLRSVNQLAAFTGSGLADLFLTTQSAFRASGNSKNSMTAASELVGADITVVYNFISAPEPVAYGLFAGAMVLGTALVRSRTRRPVAGKK